MELSKYKIETEYRRNLYFKLYFYRAIIEVRNVHNLRYYHSYLDYLTFEKTWGSKNRPLDNKDQIDRYFDYANNHADGVRVRAEYHKVIVYANSIRELQTAVDVIQPTGSVYLYKVIAPVEMDTIEFVRPPKFKFRNYFKTKVITSETKNSIRGFIDDQRNNGSSIQVNEAMNLWLIRRSLGKNGNSYLPDGYYVEYDDESFRTLLALMFGDLMKPEVFRLVQRSAST